MIVIGAGIGVFIGRELPQPKEVSVDPARSEYDQALKDLVNTLRNENTGLQQSIDGLTEKIAAADATKSAKEVAVLEPPEPTRQEKLRLQLAAILGSQQDSLALLSQAISSRDPRVQALGVEYKLEMAVPPGDVEYANWILERGGINESTLVAARYLSNDPLRKGLEEAQATFNLLEFPKNWGAAVALYEAEERASMEDWNGSFLETAYLAENLNVELKLSLKALQLYPPRAGYEEIESALLYLVKEQSDVAIRVAAIHSLAALGTDSAVQAIIELENSETPRIMVAAQRARAEVLGAR